jgi:hypothetical protein
MGCSTPKKQVDPKEFLAQPTKKPTVRNGMSFRKPGMSATGSIAPAAPRARTADEPQTV